MDEDCVLVGDCLKLFPRHLKDGSVDLVFADPPFGIGWNYDVYDDVTPYNDYMTWSKQWIRECVRVLKPNGTFWLAIGDEYGSDLDVFCRRELGLTRRSWVIWHFSFGVNCDRKFTPSHTHLFYYVMDPKDFTFNADCVRVPSARQLVYNDKRAKAGGRLPADVWVLRPQEGEKLGLFDASSDCWHVPRVCGTFKERTAHPCQMPVQVLERIVAVSSNPGDKVADPFVGSGTTLVAAKRLGRRPWGTELSPDYAGIARERLANEQTEKAAAG
jgi:DNA modification methylase